jgi:hypothetical protein
LAAGKQRSEPGKEIFPPYFRDLTKYSRKARKRGRDSRPFCRLLADLLAIMSSMCLSLADEKIELDNEDL